MLKNLASYNNIQSFIDISVLKCDPLDNCRQWGMYTVKYGMAHCTYITVVWFVMLHI